MPHSLPGSGSPLRFPTRRRPLAKPQYPLPRSSLRPPLRRLTRQPRPLPNRRHRRSQIPNPLRNLQPAVTGDEGNGGQKEREYVSVSVGFEHSCGVRADGGLACWGDNSEGASRAAGRGVHLG